MTPVELALLREAVQRDEGLRLLPYADTVGKTTIGYGRNLTDVGITKSEALVLLENDLAAAVEALERAHPIVLTLDPTRQIVLGNLAFNLGLPRLNGFVKMWAAIGRYDFDAAALEILDSKAAQQTGARYTRLSEEMRRGELLGDIKTPNWAKGNSNGPV